MFLIPKELKQCFIDVLRLRYKDEPNYESILRGLEQCFIKAVEEANSNLSPVAQGASSSMLMKEFIFDWNVGKVAFE